MAARCLRRALDQKVRKLRTMLTADEDITTELDRVVCRLMKLALQTSRGRRAPPPTRWMQCKLLDLLTLTEKAIDRRKRYFIENYPLTSVRNDDPSEKSQDMIALEKIRGDDTGMKIVDKYRHLVQPEKTGVLEESRAQYRFIDLKLEDDLSVTSAEFLKDYEYIDRHSPSLYEPEPTLTDMALFNPADEKMKLERTQAWLEVDLEVIPNSEHDINIDNDILVDSTGDTEHSTSLTKYYKKCFKRYKPKKHCIELKCVICKRSHSKCFKQENKKDKKVKDNSSKTRIIKKVSRKKSSYSNLFKEKPRRNECKFFQPTASKPIPETLTKLCQPEVMIENNTETYKEHITNFTRDDEIIQFNQTSGCISATKNSLLIDIVMDDKQETIAMRRTIGTDAEEDPMGYENETLIRSVSNTVIYEDNFFDKHDVGIENDITIFLNDINEPSTSKGIRHVSMDVQCGTDALAPDYSILSATTSITRMSSIFTAGIKIGDPCTDTTMKCIHCCTNPQLQKMSTDCCTSTNDGKTIYKTIEPRERAIGIKIKESIPNNSERMECSTVTQEQESLTQQEQDSLTLQEQELTRQEQELTMTQEQELTMTQEQESTVQEQGQNMMREQESPIMQEQGSDRAVTSLLLNADFSTETTCLKSIPSGMKIEDSGSDFCSSIASIPKMPQSLANCLTSDLKIISSIRTDVGVTKMLTRYVQPKLCCGGVQVHSYRDKQISEDTVYHGEWQNHRPKVLTKKKIFNQIIVKRTTDSIIKKKVRSKENIPSKSFVKRDIKAPEQKLPQKLNVEPTKLKPNEEKKNDRISTFVSKCVAKGNMPILTVTKVASKRMLSSTPSKNTKSAFITKKLPITFVTPTKDVPEPIRTINKIYLPCYLRKNALKPLTNGKKNLNYSVDSAKTNICMKINGPKPLVRSRTEDIKRDLLKFQSKVPVANYVILRNEVENKNSANDGQPAKTTADSGKRRGDAPTKRPISPQSQNSSTCSSPNSIATVRAVSIRPKNVSSRRHSTSSYKTSTANSESENTTPNRNKKFTKRSKSAKMSNEKTFDNKENIPQTSRQSNIIGKGSGKIAKGTFLGQKKVFIAQLKESPPLQSTANKKHKSNMNTPKTDSIVKKISTNTSVSKNSSFKFDDWTENGNSVSASTEISNMVIVLDPLRDDPYKHISDPPADTSDTINILNNRLITEWMDNSSISIDKSQSSNIYTAMRMLVEETLDFIEVPYDNNCSIDSETVILSRENLNNAAVDLSSSPISFKTVITNENNSLQSDLEQALNRSFDTTLGNESIFSLNDTKLTVTELDLLSFKSVTSVSKYSEYLSAGSSQMKLPVQSIHATSMKDIYGRKDQPFIPVPQNNAGAIANQAFSGFTINGELIAGDKPDPVNFIDSETGSMDVSRQANSEELFISGVSSDSFESCLLDEDAVVPSWLFQIISRQQEAEDEMNAAQPLIIPLPMPDDPIYDVNGNNLEGLGLGAGAGDGRGMHSDQSQDSSGHGTSLSSSATSSGAQSEQAILIDPLSFVAQFEGVPLQDSENRSFVMVRVNNEDNELGAAQGASTMPPDSQNFSHGESTRRNPRVQDNAASDVDADVSSLETDVPDLSDN